MTWHDGIDELERVASRILLLVGLTGDTDCVLVIRNRFSSSWCMSEFFQPTRMPSLGARAMWGVTATVPAPILSLATGVLRVLFN